MSRDKTARLRQTYTGESYTMSRDWYRYNGLSDGLVPDATDPQQQHLEAAVLHTLAHSVLSSPPSPRATGTLFGLAGVSPEADTLLLRPAAGHAGVLLSRLLPARVPHALAGVPGLRVHLGRRGTVTIARIGERAAISVHAGREDLQQARSLIVSAGLEPLWDVESFQPGEREAWKRLSDRLPAEDRTLWSQALRRAGLFLDSTPRWDQRAPTPEEVAGPAPERIRPRPVGPADPRALSQGVVAVTPASGKGGMGCTTLALVVGATLAQGGRSVVVLGAPEDPNGVFSLIEEQPPVGEWRDAVSFPGGGVLRVGALAKDAEHIVAAARRDADVVVIDTGSAGWHHRDVVALADVTVVAVQQVSWSRTEIVDRRPEWVRFVSWLRDQYARFPPAAATPLEQLLTWLDTEFAYYVSDRTADGDSRVYDDTDPEEVEMWWEDLAWQPADGEPVDEDVLPKENAVFDAWRADFVAFLDTEGERRHPQTWARARTHWAARNKARTLQGLTPGQPTPAEQSHARGQFLEEVEERAIQQWGAALWDAYHLIWAAADEAEDDLCAPWENQVEAVTHPLTADEIAQQLIDHLYGLPEAGTIVAVNQATQSFGQHRLTAVREALHDRGVADLVLIPHLVALAEVGFNSALLPRLAGAAARAANRLTRAITHELCPR
ncbi:hypothetical protein OG339_48810 (plasmid) [Streptosporangium sp. NBC_01495]|uniref:hypothetical protein n=1 Tax=Streptosporangium sp. NBC_01495 TaxID=2903899 RepID=UPI002E33DC59|nr:hypothetical protein [Streptosporangium sp. NBC_01495]